MISLWSKIPRWSLCHLQFRSKGIECRTLVSDCKPVSTFLLQGPFLSPCTFDLHQVWLKSEETSARAGCVSVCVCQVSERGEKSMRGNYDFKDVEWKVDPSCLCQTSACAPICLQPLCKVARFTAKMISFPSSMLATQYAISFRWWADACVSVYVLCMHVRVREAPEASAAQVECMEYLCRLCRSRQAPGGPSWPWAACPWPGA